MSSRHFLFVLGACVLPPEFAIGDELANQSTDRAAVRAAANGQDNKLIEITPDQLQFLRGVYAMNLEAPCGLPSGDNAVLAQDRGDSNGLLFFIDGDRRCAPMHAPRALLSLKEKVTMAGGGRL